MSKYKHSRSYHRYFENYAEKEVLGPNGSYVIQRVYVGQYYKADLSDDGWKRQKGTVCLWFLAVLAGYLFGALTARVSAVPLVAISTMPPLIVLLFLGIAVFHHTAAPREMEIRTLRDASQNLRSSSLAFSICMAICFCLTLVYCLVLPGFSLRETLPALLGYALSLLASGKLYLMERSVSYITLAPKQERPAESSPIRYEMPD